jgi:hypothetical protein
MKFQANIVLELRAGSIAEAGERLDRLMKDAADRHDVTAIAVDLRTPPGDAGAPPAVVLPPVSAPAPPPGPQAASGPPGNGSIRG